MKWAGRLVRVIVTAALLVWLLRQIDVRTTLVLLEDADPSLIGLAFVISLGVIAMFAWRWHLLLGALEIHVAYPRICEITLIGQFLTQFLPSSMGGEAVKLYYVIRRTGRPGEVVLSILTDRCIGVAALLCIPVLLLVIRRPAGPLYATAAMAYAATLLALGAAIALGLLLRSARPALLPPKALAALDALGRGLGLYVRRKGVLLQAFSLAVLSHLLNIAVFALLARALRERHGLLDFFSFVPLVFLPGLLPVSLGGLGVREWTFVYLFTRLGMPRQTALSISVLSLVLGTATSLVGAVLYLAKRGPGDV